MSNYRTQVNAMVVGGYVLMVAWALAVTFAFLTASSAVWFDIGGFLFTLWVTVRARRLLQKPGI